MQGIELATILVAPSAFQHVCEKDPRALVGVLGVLIEVVTGHRRNGGIRAGGYFGGHLGFSKLVLGASAGPRGPPRKGKTLRLRSFPRRSCRRTGPLHFLQGIMTPRGFLHCKYEAIGDVARDPEKMT